MGMLTFNLDDVPFTSMLYTWQPDVLSTKIILVLSVTWRAWACSEIMHPDIPGAGVMLVIVADVSWSICQPWSWRQPPEHIPPRPWNRVCLKTHRTLLRECIGATTEQEPSNARYKTASTKEQLISYDTLPARIQMLFAHLHCLFES